MQLASLLNSIYTCNIYVDIHWKMLHEIQSTNRYQDANPFLIVKCFIVYSFWKKIGNHHRFGLLDIILDNSQKINIFGMMNKIELIDKIFQM